MGGLYFVVFEWNVEFNRRIHFESHVLNTKKQPDLHGNAEKKYLLDYLGTLTGFQKLSWKSNSKKKIHNDTILQSWLVHLISDFTEDDKLKVEAKAGVPLGPYYHHNTYLLVCSFSVATIIRQMPSILWIGPYPKEAKYSGILLKYLNEYNEDDIVFSSSSSLSSLSSPPKLLVQLIPYADNKLTIFHSQNFANAWSHESSSFFPYLVFNAYSSRNIQINFPSNQTMLRGQMMQLLSWLVSKPEVHLVQQAMTLSINNWYAQSIVQTGSEIVNGPTDSVRNIWGHNLKGSGQVIGCSDTGIDYDHCYFFDPQNKYFGKEHRKIVAYFPATVRGDMNDDMCGHGTHVAGSIVGNMLETNNVELNHYIGMAPEAKIVFHDIGVDGQLEMPLLELMLDQAYEAGARIHSNSWGCTGDSSICNLYTLEAQLLDQYTWNKKNMLVIFSAGNDGRQHFDRTISSPATAKNVLAVGASVSAHRSFENSSQYMNWTQRQENAIKIFNLKGECCKHSSKFIRQYCCQFDYYNYIKLNAKKHSMNSLATFSSRGPTNDGRTKPQLVAPGDAIVSARSDGQHNSFQCNKGPQHALLSLSGTSMAAPIVAGAAALVRQYFVDGYYTKHIEPTAATLIAVLMNGAVALDGYFNPFESKYGDVSSIITKKIPGSIYPLDRFQGFGRLQLNSVLKFPESTHGLYIDEISKIYEREEINYCLRANGKEKIKITLAWIDYPAEITNANARGGGAFINNLDLIVGPFSKSRKLKIVTGNYIFRRDERNNIEHVIYPLSGVDIQQLDGYDIRVKVRGFAVPKGPQPYSIVIRGGFDDTKVIESQSGECQFDIPWDLFDPAIRKDYEPDSIPWLTIGIFSLVGGFILLACCCGIFFYLEKYRSSKIRRQAVPTVEDS